MRQFLGSRKRIFLETSLCSAQLFAGGNWIGRGCLVGSLKEAEIVGDARQRLLVLPVGRTQPAVRAVPTTPASRHPFWSSSSFRQSPCMLSVLSAFR